MSWADLRGLALMPAVDLWNDFIYHSRRRVSARQSGEEGRQAIEIAAIRTESEERVISLTAGLVLGRVSIGTKPVLTFSDTTRIVTAASWSVAFWRADRRAC